MRKPKDLYPGQIDVTTDVSGFPNGMAQNETSPGDRNGTPLEKEWLNDIWGFFECLLATAAIDYNDAPERGVPGSSQAVDAIKTLIRTTVNLFQEGAFAVADAILFGATVQTDATHDLSSGRDLAVARNAAIEGSLQVDGPAALNDGLTVANGLESSAPLLFSGTGRAPIGHPIVGPDASITLDAKNQLVYVSVGTLTANQNYALPTTGVSDGDWIHVASDGSTGGFTLTVSGAVNRATSLGPSAPAAALFVRISGAWFKIGV